MPFIAVNVSDQRAEIWTKQPKYPTASVAKTVEALALNAIMA